MGIGLCNKIAVKRNDIAHEVALEFLYVPSLPLSAYKLLPSPEKIIEGNDIIVAMPESNARHFSNVSPPPTASACIG